MVFRLGRKGNTELVSVILNFVAARRTHFEQVFDLFRGVDTVFIIDVAVWAGEGNNLSACFGHLGANAPCNVTETGYGNGLAFEGCHRNV